jgi:hypothetical protein
MAYSALQNATTMMTTELNALADDDLAVGTTAFDNTTNKDAWATAELDFGASLALSAANNNPVCYLYLIPSYDGTNYADGGDATSELVPSEYLKGTFEFNKLDGSQIAVIDKFDISLLKYTAVIFNDLGAALSATGNTLKISSFDRA